MKHVIGYMIKTLRGREQPSPSEIRHWDIFMLDVRAATGALIIAAGLFFTLTAGFSSEPWSQEREDEEWAEFKIRPLDKNVAWIESVKVEQKMDTLVTYDSLGNALYTLVNQDSLDSIIKNDTLKGQH